jgi:hypothetical protein
MIGEMIKTMKYEVLVDGAVSYSYSEYENIVLTTEIVRENKINNQMNGLVTCKNR